MVLFLGDSPSDMPTLPRLLPWLLSTLLPCMLPCLEPKVVVLWPVFPTLKFEMFGLICSVNFLECIGGFNREFFGLTIEDAALDANSRLDMESFTVWLSKAGLLTGVMTLSNSNFC